MNALTLNDFFCGAGGMACGFMNAGFDIVGAWDFDKYAVQSYAANVGDHVRQRDISEMTWDELPTANVWSFGFPCQDLSVAGRQAGLFEGKRSSMFFEVMRLLDETAIHRPESLPTFIVAENVKGLKPYLGVLRDEYEKRGYTMHIQLYNSKYWGVPQNRERYYVVGVRGDIPFEMPAEDTSWVPKLSSILEPVVDEKYYVSDEKARSIIEAALKRVELRGTHACITPDRSSKAQNGRRAKDDEEPMFTLTVQDLHGVIEPTIERVGNTHPSGRGMNGYVYDSDGLCPTLTTNKGEGIKILEPGIEVVGMLDIASHDHSRRVHDPEGLSPTITAVCGGTHHIKVFDYSKFRVRRLTPTEYGRLQAFPMDTWKHVVSNSQEYKQFGNSCTVTVVEAVAFSIKQAIEKSEVQHERANVDDVSTVSG